MLKKYKVELVGKDAPYICLGYVKSTSVKDGKLEFTRSEEESLVVSDKETMDKVLMLISKHNSNSDYVRVMDWITEVGDNKRLFRNNIAW